MRFRRTMPAAAIIIAAAALTAPNPHTRPANAGTNPPLSILQVMLDDASPDVFAHMPYLQSQPWQVFTNAYDHISMCCPARVDNLSGRFSDRDGVEDTHGGALGGSAFDDTTALPIAMHAAGYQTFLAGKS